MLRKLKEQPPIQHSTFSIYDCNVHSVYETLVIMSKKINEGIDIINEMNEYITFLKNEGISDIVLKKLELMVSDGTLEHLINTTLFENLNNEITKTSNILKRITNYIDPDNFEGTDYEKLQKAINESIQSDKETQITLNRVYDITGNTLYINRDKLPDQQFYNNHVKIVGNNGGIIKHDRGFWFSSQDLPVYEGDMIAHYTGDLRLENLWLKGVEQQNVTLIDGDKLIRTYIYDCDIDYIGCLVKSTTYTQSFYALRNKIRKGKGTLIDTYNNYDLNFSDNLVEWVENFLLIEGGANGCKITNNLIEGITGYTGIIKAGQSVDIQNNYFEMNKSYFDLTECRAYGLSIRNNYFFDTDVEKVAIYLPVNAHGNNPYQDQYTIENNAVGGGFKIMEFKSEPRSEVKILCLGNTGSVTKYHDNVSNYGVTYSVQEFEGKTYYKGDMKCYCRYFDQSITNTKLTPFEVSIPIPPGYSNKDIISIKLSSNSGDSDFLINANNIRGNELIVSAMMTRGEGQQTYTIAMDITILKAPFTQWF